MRKTTTTRVIGLVFGLMAMTSQVLAQTATLLPNAKQQYFDGSGNLVANGKVNYYVPNTTTKKNVWLDENKNTLSPNPVLLDGSGYPQPTGQTFGDGLYRQQVVDQNGIVVWDTLTRSTGGSGGGTAPAFSEGVMVGTILQWSNTTLPAKYLYAAGQAIARASYPELFTAITYSTVILCSSGIATISVSTAISDAVPIGTPLEASCFAPGATVIAKSSGQLTMSSPATATLSTTATLFPWGNGNGSSTFNVVDMRGRVPAGRNNMLGTPSSVLTSTYYGTNPDAVNALGGSQNHAITSSEIPSITASGTVASTPSTPPNGSGLKRLVSSITAGPMQYGGSGSGGEVSNVDLTIASIFSGIPQGGGIAVSATVAATGSGYTNGSQTITVSGGTCTTQPKFTVTVSGNAFSGTPALLTAGSCTVAPTNPAATTGGGGTGGTLTVTYSARPTSLIQPTVTSDYIIKALPDDSPTGPGVTSIQGMTGALTCGAGLTCNAQVISVTLNNVCTTQGAVVYRDASTVTCLAPGASGQVLQSQGPAANPVWATSAGVNITSVADRTALKALDTTTIQTVSLRETGRTGIFVWTTGNFTTSVATDTNEGIYVKANAISAGSGAWVRQFDFINYWARWFGAVNDYSTDNTNLINNMMQVANLQNTLSTATKQTAVYLNIEGGVKFASQNLTWLPSVNWVFININYFANSNTTLGVSTGGGGTNEQHQISMNSGYPGDASGAYVIEDIVEGAHNPARGVNVMKNMDNSTYVHAGTTQSIQPYDNGPATATMSYIRDENLDRFRATYTNYGANTRFNGTGVYTTDRSTTLTATNVGVGAGWAGTSVPVAGDVVRGITSLSRYVVTSLATNVLTTDWLSGTAVPGETLLREQAVFKASISGTTMTVASFYQGSGNLAVGQTCVGMFYNNGITAGTTITVSAGGGTGAYTVNNSQTVAQTLMTCGPLSVNSIQGGGVTNTDTTKTPLFFYKKGEAVLPPRTFAQLTTCSALVIGGYASVSDSNTNVWGANVAGGGANQIMAYCNGTNWTVAAK